MLCSPSYNFKHKKGKNLQFAFTIQRLDKSRQGKHNK